MAHTSLLKGYVTTKAMLSNIANQQNGGVNEREVVKRYEAVGWPSHVTSFSEPISIYFSHYLLMNANNKLKGQLQCKGLSMK